MDPLLNGADFNTSLKFIYPSSTQSFSKVHSCNCEQGSIKAVVTGSWLKRNHASRCSVKVHQMPGAMASLHSWLPAKPLSTGKWVNKLKGNQSDQFTYNCPKSITVRSEAPTFVFSTNSNTKCRMKIVTPKFSKTQWWPLLFCSCLTDTLHHV